jgi:uncharacterized protein
MKIFGYFITVLLIILFIIAVIFGVYNKYLITPTHYFAPETYKGIAPGLGNTKDPGDTVTVLAIDGGGIRGIIPAHVLKYIEKKSGQPISKLFDLMGGTSTGTIIISGLTVPDKDGKPKYSASDELAFYNKEVPKLLRAEWYHSVLTAYGLISPPLSSSNIEEQLKKGLGAKTVMRDSLTNVFFNAYSLKPFEPVTFTSWGPNSDYLTYQVVLGATAVPGMFPPVRIHNVEGKKAFSLIDGAIYVNNSSTLAFVESHKLFGRKKMILLSIGTGRVVKDYDFGSSAQWGLLQWLSRDKAVSLLVAAEDEFSTKQVRSMIQAMHRGKDIQFYRLNIRIPETLSNPLDASPENVKLLNEAGRKIVKENKKRLNKIIKELLKAQHLPAPTHSN